MLKENIYSLLYRWPGSFPWTGLTHKATIYTEAKAAVAGGVTSFMEMPIHYSQCFRRKNCWKRQYSIAAQNSLANYSFFMGTSNNNADEVLEDEYKKKDVCGVKNSLWVPAQVICLCR
jgi:dihydroorotase